MKLVIGYLYSKLMNTYGDRGNIITIAQRCAWRSIDVDVKEIGLKEPIRSDIDLYFFGGGQDQSQIICAKDLISTKKTALVEAAQSNIPMLLICGGYQLFGHYYRPKSGEEIEGAGILDAFTTAGEMRMIGNIVIELNKQLSNNNPKTLVGFENHSGKTFLDKKAEPLGRIIRGSGNNGEDRTEGAYYKNVFGCYLHGPLLPKNPLFADFLIEKALNRKNKYFSLKELDNSLEIETHNFVKNNF